MNKNIKIQSKEKKFFNTKKWDLFHDILIKLQLSLLFPYIKIIIIIDLNKI